MDRAKKAESIETLKGVFADSGAVVVTHYLGLSVAEMTELRTRLRKEGATLKVVKNRLAQKALNGAGEGASALFRGPVAKVATQYAKDNDKFTVVGAMMGEQILDVKGVDALAKLPSLDELRGKIL